MIYQCPTVLQGESQGLFSLGEHCLTALLLTLFFSKSGSCSMHFYGFPNIY